MENVTLVFLDPKGPWIERFAWFSNDPPEESRRHLLDQLTDYMIDHDAESWYALGEFSFVFLFEDADDLGDEDGNTIIIEGP